jgi:hypothetical protein
MVFYFRVPSRIYPIWVVYTLSAGAVILILQIVIKINWKNITEIMKLY